MSKRKRRQAKEKSQQSAPPAEPEVPLRSGRVELVLAAVVFIVVVTLTILRPRPTGDTFMALKGGQDVVEGKLGKPDDWAFTTVRPFVKEDRIWINQNWGTGVLFYLAHQAAGEIAIVGVKAVLTIVFAIVLVLASRELGARTSIAMLATAVALSAMQQHIDMRPNLAGMTWMAIVLWVIYLSRYRPVRIWWAVPCLALWANMHGSFVFGIGLFGLWTICYFGMLWRQQAPSAELRQAWHLPAATVAGIVLCAVTSPFGIANLTQPFSLLFGVGGQTWPLPAREMRPVLQAKSLVSDSPMLFLMVGLAVAPVVAWWLSHRHSDRRSAKTSDPQQTVATVFTVLLIILTVLMTLKARRFLPIALLFATPAIAAEFTWLLSSRRLAWATAIVAPLAVWLVPYLEPLLGQFQQWMQTSESPASVPVAGTVSGLQQIAWPLQTIVLAATPLFALWVFRFGRPYWRQLSTSGSPIRGAIDWLKDDRRGGWPTAAVAVVLLVATVPVANYMMSHYRADHPDHKLQTLFQRMIFLSKYPHGAAQFLNANEIGGRVHNDWRWEGFLRWHCPQIKVFLGGRSRQVYTPEAAIAFHRVEHTQGLPNLAALDVHLMVIGRNSMNFVRKLMATNGSPWAPIYYDGRSFVLAARTDPEISKLIDRAAAGELAYPDDATAKMSRALCLTSVAVEATSLEIQSAVAESSLAWPNSLIYHQLVEMNRLKGMDGRTIIHFLESELRRLETVDHHIANGAEILDSRYHAAALLGHAYGQLGRENEATFWNSYARQVSEKLAALRADRPEPSIERLPAAAA